MNRLLISAAHKSSGKTTLSIGLGAALRARGLAVQPFKKGPDYIDPMWLALATGRPCHNLDFFLMGADEIRTTFARYGHGADLCLIEGNKGLYDGLDLNGSNSNAALARLLQAPVVLVLDARGMTRGIAPLILGYQAFEPDVNIAGVILNRLGGSRHESKLRAVIEHYTDVPVLGAVHHDEELAILERHLGLTPSNEASAAQAQIDRIAATVAAGVDLDRLLAVAAAAPVLTAAGGTLPKDRRPQAAQTLLLPLAGEGGPQGRKRDDRSEEPSPSFPLPSPSPPSPLPQAGEGGEPLRACARTSFTRGEEGEPSTASQRDLSLGERGDSRGTLSQTSPASGRGDSARIPVKIGIARDAAFAFYYPGDLEALRAAGAELVPIDTLKDAHLPDVDALFIGGGFPEVHMQALAANRGLRAEIRAAIDGGLPAYAECGGLMYLARSLTWHGKTCEMVGAIPADVVMHAKPQGRGYVRLRETGANPWPVHGPAAPADEVRAHEFHYSSLKNLPPDTRFAYTVLRGTGIDGRHDGIVHKNLLANYSHLRDLAGNHWTRRFVDFVRSHRAGDTRRRARL